MYITDIFEDQEFKELDEIMKENGLEYKVISKTSNQFEKGLSDVWQDILIAITGSLSGGIGTETIKYAISQSKAPHLTSHIKKAFIVPLNKEEVLRKVANYSDEPI